MITLENIIKTAIVNQGCILTLHPDDILNECKKLNISVSDFGGVINYKTFSTISEFFKPIIVEEELDFLNYLENNSYVNTDYIVFSRSYS